MAAAPTPRTLFELPPIFANMSQQLSVSSVSTVRFFSPSLVPSASVFSQLLTLVSSTFLHPRPRPFFNKGGAETWAAIHDLTAQFNTAVAALEADEAKDDGKPLAQKDDSANGRDSYNP